MSSPAKLPYRRKHYESNLTSDKAYSSRAMSIAPDAARNSLY